MKSVMIGSQKLHLKKIWRDIQGANMALSGPGQGTKTYRILDKYRSVTRCTQIKLRNREKIEDKLGSKRFSTDSYPTLHFSTVKVHRMLKQRKVFFLLFFGT